MRIDPTSRQQGPQRRLADGLEVGIRTGCSEAEATPEGARKPARQQVRGGADLLEPLDERAHVGQRLVDVEREHRWASDIHRAILAAISGAARPPVSGGGDARASTPRLGRPVASCWVARACGAWPALGRRVVSVWGAEARAGSGGSAAARTRSFPLRRGG